MIERLKMKQTKYLLMCGVAFLCGCENVKDAFGLSRSQPDELSVLEKPALTVPRDFKIDSTLDDAKADKAPEYEADNASEKAQKILSQ